MKKTICGALLMLCALGATPLWAQKVSKVGTTAAPFLKIGVGGRAIGMGEAHATLAEDITAMYWNPAGLARMAGNQVLFNHYDYLADLHFDYVGIAFSVPALGAIGASVSYLGSGEIERTTLTLQEGTGEMVSAGSYAVGLAFARELTDRFSFGFNAKYIHEWLWHCSANGFAVDVGCLFDTQFHNLKLGMSISNFGTAMRMEGRDLLVQHDIDPMSEGNNSNVNAYLATDAYKLPILFRVGVSMDVARDVLHLANHGFIVAVNAVHPNDNKEYLNVGAEYRFFQLLALRIGYRQLFLEDGEGGLTGGFGVSAGVGRFRALLDYAAVDFGRLDYLHKLSLILAF